MARMDVIIRLDEAAQAAQQALTPVGALGAAVIADGIFA